MQFKPPYLLKEFVIRTSRSGGKGGQNVNKVSTRVQIDFSIPDSVLLTDEEKAVLLEKLEGKLTKEGVLQVVAQEERSQLANKEVAFRKMYNTLNRCFVVRKKRKASLPTKKSKEARLKTKKHTSEIKRMRRKEDF